MDDVQEGRRGSGVAGLGIWRRAEVTHAGARRQYRRALFAWYCVARPAPGLPILGDNTLSTWKGWTCKHVIARRS